VKIKWRNIFLFLIVVGTIGAGAFVLLSGDEVLAKLQTTQIPGISKWAQKAFGNESSVPTALTPTISTTPVPAQGPKIVDGVSWFTTPEPTPTRRGTGETTIKIAAPAKTARVDTDVLNLRAGPGTNYQRTGQVHRGDELEIVGRNADRTWLKVIALVEREAWVYADLVTWEGSLDGVPVVLAPELPPPVQ